jgi:hypothetical protein
MMIPIKKMLGLIVILLFTGNITLNGQYGLGRRNFGGFYPDIPDLTEKQRSEINVIADKHWFLMDSLRNELWMENDLDKRNELIKESHDLAYSYRKSVLGLLSKEQKDWLTNDSYYYGRPGYDRRSQLRGAGWGMGFVGRGYGYNRGFGRGLGPYGGGFGFGRGYGRGYGRGMGPGW